MKTMVKIFVDHEHLVRVINTLTELGITGFYLMEYQGMAPKTWKTFRLNENPDMALKAIRDHAEPGVMVNTVVGSDKCEKIIKQLEVYDHRAQSYIYKGERGLKYSWKTSRMTSSSLWKRSGKAFA
jgi:nitrogen regulatory protein PII-like uncharacterized protein